MEPTYDIAVIGGGVVGCATLSELTNHGYRCILLEKNNDLLSEASSGNSGMLHTGFDVDNNGHEIDCIRYTQERVFTLLAKLGVPVNKIGATMVAWTDQQKDQLAHISDKCRRQRLTDFSILTSSDVHRKEPHLQGMCQGGLWIPGEAVTDSWLFPLLLASDAKRKRAKILLNTCVQSCDHNDTRRWSIQTTSGPIRALAVVNCGGLYGDIVDLLAGKSNLKINPRKGQYLVYDTTAKPLINSSILPVPTALGKGIIIFRSVYDNVVVGPTAEHVPERTRAPIDDDITRRLYDVTNHLVPEMNAHKVVCMYTGVRPATDVKDYIIHPDVERNWITVGGIRSTGVSGCLGIAAKVRHHVEHDLNLEFTRGRSLSLSQPEVKFSKHGMVTIDGHQYKVTHPLSHLGYQNLFPKL